jgi:hypothetical protein
MSKLNAWLRLNPLTADPTDYVAVPLSNGSLTVADIISDLIAEGMEIKTETALDIITRFNRKAAERVVSGYNVNTGLVYMRPVIKGTFFDKTWNPAENSVYVAMNQGRDLREALAGTTVEILGVQADPMEVYAITDSTTGKTDGSLTPGRNAELKGTYIKVVGDNEAVGISFRNTDTGEETRLATTDIVLNEPSRLLILVPATLGAGEYELSVTTQYSQSNSQLKNPRTAILGIPVVIA